MREAVTFFFGERLLDRFVLAPEDSHHAVRVLRYSAGDTLWCIDGEGSAYEVLLTKDDVRRAEGDIVSESPNHNELDAHVILICGLTQPARFDWVVEKATELGAAELWPVVGPTAVGPGRLRRWQRLARSAAKQCRRGRIPRVREPASVAGFLPELPADSLRLLADPGGRPLQQHVPAGGCLVLAVGPDVGYSDADLALLRQVGFQEVGLGGRRLRAETAALHLLSVVVGRLQLL